MSKQQEHFESILPDKKIWFSPKEVAAVIGRSDQYVRDCLDSQRILGHALKGRAIKGKEIRKSYQIHRTGLILFLLETANYSSEDMFDRIIELVSDAPKEFVQKLLSIMHKRIMA